MFAVSKRADEPIRVTLAEAQGDDDAAVVTLTPITPGMRRRATKAAQRLMAELEVGNDGLVGDVLLDVSEAVSRELMRLGVEAIAGIVDEETGQAFELTPDRATRLRTASDENRPTGTIDNLLADERVFAKLDEDYVMPDALRRAEKNGLSGSPNGTSTAATPGNATANRRARRATKAGAKSARTKNSSSKRTRAKGSGKS